MRHARWLAALLALAGAGSGLHGQGLLLPAAGYGSGGGIAFTIGRHHRLSIYLSGGYSPYGYPAGGYLGLSYYSPPVVVMPPPDNLPFVEVRRPLPPLLPPLLEGPLPRDMPGRLRPLAPENREHPRPRMPPADVPPAPAPAPQPEEPKPRPKQEEPPPRPKQEEPPPKPKQEEPPPPKPEEPPPKPKPPERHWQELPLPPEPDPNPNNEAGRQIVLGRAAFAAGEYGRAAFHFRQAAATDPAAPMGHFLLAQALFALSKYDEAVAAIHAGLRLQPDWPERRFRPLELYGDNVADYPEHLSRLEQAVARQPDEPVLLFLYAYELWFDGRQDEALPVFQRAARVIADKADVERFLTARRPGAPMI
jgi:hypothetical protein